MSIGCSPNGRILQIGFPVLTVSETKDGIKIRQDRYLETGPAEAKDNQTIWHVPYGRLYSWRCLLMQVGLSLLPY